MALYIIAALGVALGSAVAGLVFGLTRRRLGTRAAVAVALGAWAAGMGLLAVALIVFSVLRAPMDAPPPRGAAATPPPVAIGPPPAPSELGSANCPIPIHADGDQPRAADVLAKLYGGTVSAQGRLLWTPTAADLALVDAASMQVNGPWEARVSSTLDIGGEFGPEWMVFVESHDPRMAGADGDAALIGGVALSQEGDHYCLDASQRALLLAGANGIAPTPTRFPLDEESVVAARWDDGQSHTGEIVSQMTLVAYWGGALRVVFRHATQYDNSTTKECAEDPTQCRSWQATVATRFLSCEEPMDLVVTTTDGLVAEGRSPAMLSYERFHLGPTGYVSTERVEAPPRPATAPAMATLPFSTADLPPELVPCGAEAKGLRWSDTTGEHRFVLCNTDISDPDDEFDIRYQVSGLLQDLAPQTSPPVEVFLDQFSATDPIVAARAPELFDVDGDGQGEVFFEYQVYNSQGVDTARRALVLLEGKDRYQLNGETELRDGCNHYGGDFAPIEAPEPFRTSLTLEFHRERTRPAE